MKKKFKPYFQPWIGTNYQTSNPKILVIGDSHWCGGCHSSKSCGVRGMSINEMEDCRGFTKKLAKKHRDHREGKTKEFRRYMLTYLRFDKMMCGSDVTPEDSVKLWDSIAFYNFVQTAWAKKHEIKYTDEDYLKSNPYALNVIDELNPDVIFVWGHKAYNYLEKENWKEGTNCTNGSFTTISGHRVRCMEICHPASSYVWGGAAQDEWHNKIHKFIMKSKK